MAKEFTCEVLKEYFEVDDTEKTCTKVCEIKWNGRSPKGYDIRKYDKDTGRFLKGVTVTYDGFKDLIKNAISLGLIDTKAVRECADEMDSKVITMDDFDKLFKTMNDEMIKYSRDKYGHLRDKNGCYVITRRRKTK